MAKAAALAMASLSVLTHVSKLIESSLSKKGTKVDKKIEAVRAMQRAVNNTRQYLVNSNNNYEPNTELSNLWNDAFAAMIPIDKTLARRLNNKSRFWSDPHKWLVNQGSMKLIPNLNELDERCDSILVELENRK